ncbi:MAG: thiamine pyrophosphate-binding protein [Rhodothermales bacterium]|nr:thiamine pyrophosphate-binding protein [Rhodothermales bacterium]
MKRTGAELAVYALEQIGVRRTFGIPGVHNTELYDQLGASGKITPYLVTHEAGAAFIADGLSRTSDEIGTCVIVPAAGTTHAMSGIAEAFLDGVPMLIISGGIRRDTGRSFQLHQIDQGKLLEPVTKSYFLIESHADIIPTMYRAFEIATTGVPGPVFIEIPVEIQLFRGHVDAMPTFQPGAQARVIDEGAIDAAIDLLTSARRPGIYVGWGAVDASNETKKLAERLVAPVATTVQGVSSFSADHPLHTGVGFGAASVPASRNAFDKCDCLLAVGARFSELATGSYGMDVPERLIHIDISADVFDRNYPSEVSILGDASFVLHKINERLGDWSSSRSADKLAGKIRKDKSDYLNVWLADRPKERVSPGRFFSSLRETVPDDAILVLDDGKHTFLAAELFPVRGPRRFISPTDFNCMGYCVPAAIGAKLGNPDKMVVAVVGDGAFMMTGMELITAVTNKVGLAVFVFHDGELGQISQFQQIPLNRKTCTIIGDLHVDGVAHATGAAFLSLDNDTQVQAIVQEACEMAAGGETVVVDVRIDYSRKTCMTKGVVETNLKRFPMGEKARFVGRAARRHLLK